MAEKEEIEEIIRKFKKTATTEKEDALRFKGKVEAWQAQGENTVLQEAFLETIETFEQRDTATARFLGSISTWIQRVEAESMKDHQKLLKLLGLMPDATEQDIQDAIDDVAPVFADYRKKKRGT